jgi:excisionase family DNA binding protein
MQSFPPDLPKIGYSIREACQVSSLGRTTIYKHIASGRLRATRIGGRTVILAASLHALITGTFEPCDEAPERSASPRSIHHRARETEKREFL